MAARIMKRRIFAGNTCEQYVYMVPAGVKDVKNYDPEKVRRDRFKTEEERKKHRENISRFTFIRNVNANMEPGDWYATLTMDDDWEVHTFDEARRIRSNFIRTIQRACPDAVIFAVMGRGKGTQRIHFHMLIKNVSEEIIDKKWKYGRIKRIVKLRAHNWYDGVDHGADFTGIANYFFDHWTEEQGGHRWFQTKNAKQPERENPTEVRIGGGYSEKRPPRAPKGYKLVTVKTNPYGYLYYKYVVVPEKDKKRTTQRTDRTKRRLY